MYRISIASDHAGFELKSSTIKLLEPFANKVIDCGTNSNAPVDYPDYAKLVCDQINEEDATFGILICGSGIGMSIAANRFSNIRAALCMNEEMAFLARAHNNANILVMGSRLINFDQVKLIVNKFFTTKFEGGRHSNRIAKIS
jgi:ribose 5-phosphate isomerase B